MTDAEIAVAVAALALQRSGKMSASGVRDLMMRWRRDARQIGSIDAALDLAGVVRATVNGSVAEAQGDIDKGLRIGVSPIPIWSDQYPAILRHIADAPPIIFVRGDASVLQLLPGVAVVGTRKASPHGLRISERLAEHVASQGWVVVSGLALGIDAAAHEGAILGGTPTIAVLAHGLEKAQPSANQPLAQRILDAGGLWVSEHPVGVKAKPAHFVWRNRIQVGLSCASVIVEGEEQSGSATQAEFCLRNKRTLFGVLPEAGSKVSTVSALPRMLVGMRGAIPIYSKADYPAMIDAIKRAAHTLQSN
jgi:DNA processing protein